MENGFAGMGSLVAACILSAAMKCLAEEDDSPGTLQMIMGLYIAVHCLRIIRDIAAGIL